MRRRKGMRKMGRRKGMRKMRRRKMRRLKRLRWRRMTLKTMAILLTRMLRRKGRRSRIVQLKTVGFAKIDLTISILDFSISAKLN
jgi:hypothetical protein